MQFARTAAVGLSVGRKPAGEKNILSREILGTRRREPDKDRIRFAFLGTSSVECFYLLRRPTDSWLA